MVKKFNRLTARTVATVVKPGRHGDGGGLYLKVDRSGAKRWIFMFERAGKQREAGLGSANAVPLAKAREIAASFRASLADGRDPIESRRAAQIDRDSRKTFGDVAEDFLKSNAPSWRNTKHRAQWRMTLERYGKPLMGLPVETVDTPAVLAALQPIWQAKPETASRLRGRIEAVLDAARVQGMRSGENPARWRGHLDKLLPKPKKLSRGHHAAMPSAKVPAFLTNLRERPAIGAWALEFLVLTAARTGEVIGARWSEFDFGAKIWTVPAARMKAGREHRVPLSTSALAILEKLAEAKSSDFVFPGQRLDRPPSGMAMEMVLRRMNVRHATVHGFRSAFRDWAGDCTAFPREIAEAALAHVAGDATERAYRRGDALEKRRELMEAWANFCEQEAPVNVVPAMRKGR
ncbi:MAG: integrase arm-type DNA-binding domain-containing protein [Methylocella sp.]